MKPLRIEIANFGAITHTEIDLSNVTLAAIAGPNGAGKSTAFTTAPRFALFGTVKDGTSVDDMVRCGSIEASVTFDFEHQGDAWRVIRTRSIKGRGKSTLELQRQSGDTWTSESGASIAETQKKIIDLLGLTDDIFVASSLILQGDAGNFTKRRPGERKAILAQILQLDQYEILQEKAKAKASETNISLERIKAQSTDIMHRLAGRDALEGDKLTVETQLLSLSNNIRETETALQDAQVELAGLQAKINQADELGRRIEGLQRDLTTKATERVRQQKRRKDAQEIIDQEPVILNAVAEYDGLRDEITALRVRKNQQNAIFDEASRLRNELTQVEASLDKGVREITRLEEILANRSQLEAHTQEYEIVVAKLTEFEKVKGSYEEHTRHLVYLENQLELCVNKFNTEKRSMLREADLLRNKSKLLQNANCVDIENAQCAFLADAKMAKEQLADLETKIAGMVNHRETELHQEILNTRDSIDWCGYDPGEHQAQKDLFALLKPKVAQFAQLSGMLQLLDNHKTQVTDLRTRQTDIETRLEDMRNQYKALSDGLKELPVKERRLAELQQLVDLKDKLLAAREAEASATALLETLDVEFDALSNQITILKEEHTSLGNADTLHQDAQDKVDGLRTTLNTYRTEQTALTAKLGGIQAQLDALEADAQQYETLLQKMAPLAKKLARWQTLVKAFGRDGIQALILENAVPELERIANDILGQMSGGKNYLRFETQKELKSRSGMAETLNIIVGDWAGERIYETYSGGEQLRIDFAIRFALAEMLARRAGSRVSWCVVDEGFGSQSEEFLPLVTDCVKSIANRFEMMLVISHIKAVQEAFEERIEFMPATEEGAPIGVKVA